MGVDVCSSVDSVLTSSVGERQQQQQQQQPTVQLCRELELGIKTKELLPKVILDEL